MVSTQDTRPAETPHSLLCSRPRRPRSSATHADIASIPHQFLAHRYLRMSVTIMLVLTFTKGRNGDATAAEHCDIKTRCV
ncbi:hypothetical protein HYPSUDRAFT_371933 [Hypholoma sublateritium FD-334 SS-4]|uniref:Uncharacterized protein n=1 Tax=Hypholoma sublateritium (strain FD-334 SS-4) TaxID=945553 RepID=A0A0D2LX17_HYPSF|nr:hypothetical protein HYPSUDRAFT_371933 [Hypholoma sublateritium FD-334 SS-4]